MVSLATNRRPKGLWGSVIQLELNRISWLPCSPMVRMYDSHSRDPGAIPSKESHDLIAVTTLSLTPCAIVKVGATHEIMISVDGIRSISLTTILLYTETLWRRYCAKRSISPDCPIADRSDES